MHPTIPVFLSEIFGIQYPIFAELCVFKIKQHRNMMSGLELELHGLNETLRITIEKKNLLQKELALAFDPNMKFMLEKQVQ
jgi:hypothetical protein